MKSAFPVPDRLFSAAGFHYLGPNAGCRGLSFN